MNSTISVLISIFVTVLVGITGATIFISDRMVNRYRKEAEEAVAKAKKSSNEVKAKKAEADIGVAGIELAKKVYNAVRVGEDAESSIGANTSPTELSEEEKRIAKEVSKKPDTDSK